MHAGSNPVARTTVCREPQQGVALRNVLLIVEISAPSFCGVKVSIFDCQSKGGGSTSPRKRLMDKVS